MVQEAGIKGGIVNDHLGALHKLDEFVGYRRKRRLVRQKLVRQTMDGHSAFANFTPRVQVRMKIPTGTLTSVQLDAADFDDSVAGTKVESGCFSIKDDAAHSSLFRSVRSRSCDGNRLEPAFVSPGIDFKRRITIAM